MTDKKIKDVVEVNPKRSGPVSLINGHIDTIETESEYARLKEKYFGERDEEE